MGKYVVWLILLPVLCGQQTSRRPRGRQPQTGISDLETPVATFHGTLRSLTKKELVLELGEDQAVTFHISGKTRFRKDSKSIKPSAISVGTHLAVDGKRDVAGNTDAVAVTVEKSSEPRP